MLGFEITIKGSQYAFLIHKSIISQVTSDTLLQVASVTWTASILPYYNLLKTYQ